MSVQQPVPSSSKTESTSYNQWVRSASNKYVVYSDIPYLKANNYEVKLDVFQPAGIKSPVPTLIFFHGGGWVEGSRSTSVLHILPYLEMGMAVVNVDYRLANVSLAPAAVEDCRCALKWVITNAKDYMFDVNRIVLAGRSAGGHLALTTGFLPDSANLDWRCYSDDPVELKAAAIINWFGITDVNDLLEGPNFRTWAASWFGANPQRATLARTLSPLVYVRKGVPPVFTVHGEADPDVPYSQAVRLHRALNEVGVSNQLMTIRGGGHGHFTDGEMVQIFDAIRVFLAHTLPN